MSNNDQNGNPEEPTAYLTIREAARHLRVSKSTLYNRIADGSLNPTKLKRRTLIPRAQVEALGEAM